MNTRHIHFIGIGGIGMSGLALVAKAAGYTVSGCDTNASQKTVQNLTSHDCQIAEQHGGHICFDPSITLMVYSTDTQRPMAEKEAALQNNSKVIHRSELLAYFMDTKTAIAITGAHGKTTTTGLLSHIFMQLGLEPTCIIGGISTTLNANALQGNGPFLIAEADESDRSFIILPAAIKVITNIDFEHVETYANIDDIKKACLTFLHNHQEKTIAHVLCIDNQPIKDILPLIKVPYQTYGTSERADIHITDVHLFPFHSTFTIHCKKNNLSTSCTLPIPGIHNVLNATGAITAAYVAGVDIADAAALLHTFKGVDRRFTIRGRYNNALVIDDYAHHPSEIHNTITAAKKSTKGKLYVFYQPHRITRTIGLWNNFVQLWQNNDEVDHVFIMDIYTAGETIPTTLSSKDLIKSINKKNCDYVENDIIAIKKALTTVQVTDADTILFLGAGNISQQSIVLTCNQ
ncbi:UDP-N-acetylmuramate--L-alanine ligase [Candidatus Dependentiae bacterium]|nr:MAG: UDP-N-acetylmuramate--L-alanine ligase [Candidatus Dependentiae bacterium]